MRASPVLLVALLLLVAGCAAPVADSGSSTPSADDPASVSSSDAADDGGHPDESDDGTGADAGSDADATDLPPPEVLAAEYDVEEEAGLPADADLTFARIQVLMSEPDARPPDRVQVFGEGRMILEGGDVSRFRELTGITYPEGQELVAAGYVDGRDRIVMNRNVTADPRRYESVLAHESVHIVQYEQDAFATTNRNIGDDREFRSTVDARLAYRSIVEGTAIYAETEYWERYDGNGTAPNERMTEGYYEREGAMRFGLGPYHWGSQHVADRVNDSTEFRAIYENPPRTTSEVIHGVDEDAPPVADLDLTGDATGDWRAEAASGDRKGELYVRVALATELTDDRAADAGTGWRNDWQLSFTDGTERSYVWALRFEDEANATAFERAAKEYLDGRGERETIPAPGDESSAGEQSSVDEITVWRDDDPRASYRVERTSDDTVVLILGQDRFVEETVVVGDDGDVEANSP